MLFGALLLVLLQASPQTQVTSPQAQADQAKATVRGHVYALDSGAPLKRAQVTLRGIQRASEPQGAITDAQGGFEFKNVDPGTYTLYSSKTGFVQAVYGRSDPQRPATTLQLRPGQEFNDADMRLIRTGAISGKVTDEDGEPLPNIPVQAVVRSYVRGQGTVMSRGGASTDDHGQYRIFNLPPGRYYVQASPSRSYSSSNEPAIGYAPVFYPNAAKLQDAERLELTGGADLTRIDLSLRTVQLYSISGKVIDGATGKPASEGYISVQSANVIRTGGGGSQIRPDGSFTLNGVAAGTVYLQGNSGNRQITMTVEVGAADMKDLIVTASPGVSVQGRISAEGGALPESLRVNLNRRDLLTFGYGGGGSAIVNKDGSFEIANIRPGDYDISVFRNGPSSGGMFYVRDVRKGAEAVRDRILTVGDSAVSNLEVVLDFRTATLTGKASDENGDPLAGTMIVAMASDARKRSLDGYYRLGGTSPTGAFKLPGMIPGEYLVLLWPSRDGYQLMDPDILATVEKYATHVTLAADGTVDQDLRLTAEIRAAAQKAAQ